MNLKKGFTLIELLVVISIIGLLSSIVVSNLTTAKVKAKDTRRKADMHNILVAINLFYNKYGYLPTTSGSAYSPVYSELNAGGWDYSSQGGFMTFLQTNGDFSTVPVDPKNDMTGDGAPSGTYAYRYYCYTGPTYFGLHLGYWSEQTGAYIIYNDKNSGNWSDSSYVCK